MEKIKKEIENIDIGAIVSDMVKIPSYSFMEEQEREISLYIKSFFDKEGIPCRVVQIEEGRYNVTALLKGEGCGKSLMLSGHTDTVPPYDMEEPFSGRIHQEKVFGRGACDMKGPLAAMMVAMAAIKRSGISLKGDLYFTGVADEEEQGKGAAYLIEHDLNADKAVDGVIVGEPTGLHISPGHKGLEWIEVDFSGKKVHGGRQNEGVNAIEMAARFINRIYETYMPLLKSRDYPVLGPPTINIGTIQGGDQPSTVPDRCILTLDRRMVPSETIQQVYDELGEIAEKLHQEDPRFECEIRDMFEDNKTLPHIPFVTEEQDPLMMSIKKACAETGVETVIEPFPAWTDAGFISSCTQSTCVVIGPGQLAKAHSPEECVEIAEVSRAAEIYALCALDYCGFRDCDDYDVNNCCVGERNEKKDR